MLYRKFCGGNNVLFLEKLAIFGKMGRMGIGIGEDDTKYDINLYDGFVWFYNILKVCN